MAVDKSTLAELIEQADALPDSGALQVLSSTAEVLGYLASCARSEGEDEVADVELVLTAAALPRNMLVEAERVLRPLGYLKIADLVRRFARRAPKAKPTKRQGLPLPASRDRI